MNYKIIRLVRGATIAGASAIYDTPYFNPFGARAVLLSVKATNAIVPTTPVAVIVKESDASGALAYGNQAVYQHVTFRHNSTTGDMSVGWERLLVPTDAANVACPYILHHSLAVRFVGNAGVSPANDVTGVDIDVILIYDEAGPPGTLNNNWNQQSQAGLLPTGTLTP